uniref:Uncharacterized protein n=1 Tax=Myoviridae sp. ctBtT5 TaxID=2825048 RepID=A0A8S5PY21_9CAUD|nr:MAG TPA: hypothetical protein [Myoviridae sp. ctBtT5]
MLAEGDYTVLLLDHTHTFDLKYLQVLDLSAHY